MSGVERDGSRIDAGVYEKNRRMTIEKGTRAASSLRTVRSEAERYEAEARVIREAREEWIETWGALPWGLTTIAVTHMTAQVIAEVRVEP